jgi:hypothetical protein
MTKAKACEEMIMFEKQTIVGQWEHPSPDLTIVEEFHA